MTWVREALDQLQASERPDGARSYSADPSTGDPATEPTAFAAMALAAHGRSATTASWIGSG